MCDRRQKGCASAGKRIDNRRESTLSPRRGASYGLSGEEEGDSRDPTNMESGPAAGRAAPISAPQRVRRRGTSAKKREGDLEKGSDKRTNCFFIRVSVRTEEKVPRIERAFRRMFYDAIPKEVGADLTTCLQGGSKGDRTGYSRDRRRTVEENSARRGCPWPT